MIKIIYYGMGNLGSVANMIKKVGGKSIITSDKENIKNAKKILAKEINWRDYGRKHHESIFTKFFQSYWLSTKFEFDKRRAHLSSMILAGQITREKVLKELEELAYDISKLDEDMEYLSKKLGISVDEFKESMSQLNKHFTDYANEYKLEQFFSKLKKFLGKFF